MVTAPRVGVLALQGAFRRHAEVIEALGATPVEVRLPADLETVERLIMPGGESTTMSFMLRSNELEEPLRKRLADGMPVLAALIKYRFNHVAGCQIALPARERAFASFA